jgi:RHS repeat-associated protein
MDAGDRWMLNNVAGKPIRMWDSRDHVLRTTYDGLQRPTQLFVKTATDSEILAEKMIYGEEQGDAKNHRGRIYQHFDSAGVATNVSFDFKENLERSKRQLVQDYTKIPNWSNNPVLETEIFSSSTRYDALNRPIQLVAPHSSKPNTKLNVIRPGYNKANLLERMDVWLGETTELTTLLDPQSENLEAVRNIDYDAKGQRTQIEYGNGAKTEYTYDEQTFRLTHLKTARGGAILQDLFYTYDPVGNITRILEDAQQTIFFKGEIVLPQCDYIYDAIYRLIEASGREHIGQIGQPETTWDDKFRVNLPHPNDGQAMRNYTEQYLYDAVGNFEKLIHQAANGNWTRAYAYNESSSIELGKQSNRLSSTTVGARTEPYTYDAHGNMTSMPHLTLMQWDYKDRLSATSRQAVNDMLPPKEVPETAFYVYEAGGERTRKVTERQNGTRKNERIYLGGFEIYREFNSNGDDIKLERETLHIMDEEERIALIETRTQGDDGSLKQLIRFQFGNHLGSVNLELDNKANVISYEEYYPYGSTSYQAIDKNIKVAAKRYQYTGKERDEETGLCYHGARYYAGWLGRWVSADPLRLVDGKDQGNRTKSTYDSHEKTSNDNLEEQRQIDVDEHINLYRGNKNNPVNLIDPDGQDPISKAATVAAKALAQRFFRELGEKGAKLATRKIGRVALKELAEGLLPKVEKHILEHADEAVGKATHTLFQSGMSKETLLALIKDTIKTGGKPVLSEMSESGKFAWIIEKEFKDKIGEKGQKILRVVVDKEGKLVTAFPVDKLIKRVAIKGIQVSGQLAAVAFLTTLYEKEAQAADADTAARYKAVEDNKSWLETTLEWIGPFGLLDSSSIGLEPNFNQIGARTTDAISDAERELGRELTSDEAELIQKDIYNIWVESLASYKR